MSTVVAAHAVISYTLHISALSSVTNLGQPWAAIMQTINFRAHHFAHMGV
jgi:hypothetical protein